MAAAAGDTAAIAGMRLKAAGKHRVRIAASASAWRGLAAAISSN